MRLIDADELYGRLAFDFEMLRNGALEKLTSDDILETIHEQPTVDPVNHGKWLHGREVSRDYIGDVCVAIHYEKWWCSKCTAEGRPLWNYCPNCGAYMI